VYGHGHGFVKLLRSTQEGDVVDELALVIQPGHEVFDSEELAEQVRGLTRALQEDVGGVHIARTPVPGTRGGGLAEIVLALGTSGAITAAVAAFKHWLDRDKARKIAIKIRTPSREIEITANAANLVEVERLIRSAGRS
jgi:hypothetical protein